MVYNFKHICISIIPDEESNKSLLPTSSETSKPKVNTAKYVTIGAVVVVIAGFFVLLKSLNVDFDEI